MKLAVCDLDGTLLLNGEKKLKNRIFDLINVLKDKDVLFACASGRTYGELKRIFENGNLSGIYFISSDGALITKDDETIYEKHFDEDAIKYFFNFDNVVFHSKFISYIKAASKMLLKQTVNEYKGHVLSISSSEEITSPVYKITVLGNTDDADKTYSKIYDGRELSDFAPAGSDKGKSVDFLCRTLNIKKENLYVIGDNLNDIPMLLLTPNSYCVKSSKYKTKRAAKHETLSGEAFLTHLAEIL